MRELLVYAGEYRSRWETDLDDDEKWCSQRDEDVSMDINNLCSIPSLKDTRPQR